MHGHGRQRIHLSTIYPNLIQFIAQFLLTLNVIQVQSVHARVETINLSSEVVHAHVETVDLGRKVVHARIKFGLETVDLGREVVDVGLELRRKLVELFQHSLLESSHVIEEIDLWKTNRLSTEPRQKYNSINVC